MNMISQNVQVVLAVDPTVQGNDGIERIPRYGCQTITDQTPCFTVGRRQSWVEAFLSCFYTKTSPVFRKREKLDKSENISCFHWSADQPFSTRLQPLLNVDSGNQTIPEGSFYMISGFIEITVHSFGRKWTIQMLIQLSSDFGGSSSMLSSHNAF